MVNGVVLGKLRNLEQVLTELRSVGELTVERLSGRPLPDPDRQKSPPAPHIAKTTVDWGYHG